MLGWSLNGSITLDKQTAYCKALQDYLVDLGVDIVVLYDYVELQVPPIDAI